MEPRIGRARSRILIVITLSALASGSIAACGRPTTSTATVADWCWSHHRLAPPGALASDDGPATAADAEEWDAWLGTIDDVPEERRNAHRVQRGLIDDLIETGTWSGDDRARYRTAAESDPTPSTVCETVGARILVDDAGALPPAWQDRFLDPNDPAHSTAALDSTNEASVDAGLDR